MKLGETYALLSDSEGLALNEAKYFIKNRSQMEGKLSKPEGLMQNAKNK